MSVFLVDSPEMPEITYILNPLIAKAVMSIAINYSRHGVTDREHQTATLAAIENFTDGNLTAGGIVPKIATACNAFLFETDVHVAFTEASAWGLKAETTPNGQVSFY